MTSRDKKRELYPVPREPERVTRADILLVGMYDRDARAVPSRLFGALAQSTVEVDFVDLTAPQMADAMAVLSPLISYDFDAVELAGRLESSNFTGRYVAFALDVPNPDSIKAEVARVAPGVAFDIVSTGQGPHLAGPADQR
ncbi:hypothetical protein [Jannaschia sp. LMIT008]|uniref:hypothetical protein n=1 Tax=Jannaschia maritima TaxID=3032585 RepID=UPI002810DF90|nr:hypothetical protein [Jannaschia sp. LMIT008]